MSFRFCVQFIVIDDIEGIICVITGADVASSPGSNAGAGGKREPGIHCLRMRQKYTVNDVICN